MIALYFWLFEDVHPVHFHQHDLHFRSVHFKVIYCWGKSPIGVIRFIPEPDANILWMRWRFHRQLWYLEKEKKSPHTHAVEKKIFSILCWWSQICKMFSYLVLDTVPEAPLSSYSMFYESYLSQALQVSYNIAQRSSHRPGFHIVQVVKHLLLMSKRHSLGQHHFSKPGPLPSIHRWRCQGEKVSSRQPWYQL